jgi:hypothetical protein
MPGDSGVLVVTRVRSTTTKCTRGCGCNGHPAFPTPSQGREIHQSLGRFASRGRERVSGLDVIASEATKIPDSVIQGRCQRVRPLAGPMAGSASSPESKDSPMRNCASEVRSGACHRAAQGADPLGPSRNDGIGVANLRREQLLTFAHTSAISARPASRPGFWRWMDLAK